MTNLDSALKQALDFFRTDHVHETWKDVHESAGVEADKFANIIAENLPSLEHEELKTLEPEILQHIEDLTRHLAESATGKVASNFFGKYMREKHLAWNNDKTELTVMADSNAKDLNPDSLYNLVKGLSDEERNRAETLNLKNCHTIDTLKTSDGQTILSLFPNLKSLDLSGCFALTDISQIQDLPLEELHLANCESLTQDQMKHIESLSELKTLNLSRCYGLKERLIPHKILPQLNSLSLAGNRQLKSLAGFEKAVRLQHLDLTDTSVPLKQQEAMTQKLASQSQET